MKTRAAAALLGTLLAAEASAYVPPTFNPPELITVEDCRDPDFLRRASAGQHDRCVQLLGESLAEDVDAADADGRLLAVPVARLGADRLEAESIDSLRIAPPPTSIAINWAHFWYERSGDRVESCDEYVYQTFHTWSRFEHLARAAGDDARAVFDLAYGDADVALGTLHVDRSIFGSSPMRRRRGSSAMALWDPLPAVPQVPDNTDDLTLLPKNDFFALSDDELRMVQARDPWLHFRLELGRYYWGVRLGGPGSAHLADTYPTPWQWHAEMSDRLADVPDAELRVIARRRADFRALLDSRRALRREGRAVDDAAVRAADDAILDALAEADDLGCLDQDIRRHDPERGLYYPTRCDWAPDDFLPALTRQMQPHVDWYRGRCEADAPDPAAVADGYDYRTAYGLARHSASDPYRDEYQLELYLRRRATTTRYYVSQFDLAGSGGGEPLIPHFQKTYGDRQSWGSARWAKAELGHSLSWGLADRAVRGLEDLNPHAGGSLWADAWLFGSRRSIFRAEAGFDLRRDRRVLDLSIRGTDYLELPWEDEGGARRELAHFDVVPRVGEPTEASAGGEVCTSLDPAGVPFRLCAGIVGRIGVEVDGGSVGDTTTFEVRPYARVDAMGHAGPSVAGVGGGAYIEVNLLDAGLPTRVETTADDVAGAEIGIDVQGDLVLRSLAGEIGGYVEFPRICVPFTDRCVGGRYSTSFFDWPAAIDETFPLFAQSWVADVPTWIAICADPDVHCDR